MNPNQNKGDPGGSRPPKKRSPLIGAILWAVILVILINFIAGEISNAGTVEVAYSEFVQMVEEDKVATVQLSSNKYTFYLKEDLPENAADNSRVREQALSALSTALRSAKANGLSEADIVELLKQVYAENK